MRKVITKGIIIGSLLVMVSTLTMYLGLAYYYRDGFSYNTWINGVYCTGKTIEAVNEELMKESQYDGLTITDSDGKSYTISPEEVSMKIDYLEALTRYQQMQQPLLWIDNLIGNGGEKTIAPTLTYDTEAFETYIKSLPFYLEMKEEDRKTMLCKGNNGYYFIDERSHALNAQKAYDTIRQAFETYQDEINLEETGCYENLPLTEEMQEQKELWEKVKVFQDCGIVYLFGEERVPVDSSVACDFMELDADGNIVVDEEGAIVVSKDQIDAYIDQLADEYDTVGTDRVFQSTRGDMVLVKGGIYGNKIDRDAEKEYLYQAFVEQRKELHEPQYLQKAKLQGKKDIGDTYIEVDMTEQKMYYYENGELRLETEVVTGNISKGRGTPEGTNYVYGKQMNRILRGADYETPVKYWMPVYKSIGLHDSTWRSSYGGTIYKTDGSHGCVNTPIHKMEELYNMVEIGTPCILFY